MRPLRLRHRADPAELGPIRRRVAGWARERALPDDVVADLQLALGEAVANGVEHAYRPGEQGAVDVEVQVRGEPATAVTVRVCDEGRWRPASPSPGYRGRGLQIIHTLSSWVHVVPGARGTEVRFEIPIPDAQ